jgi:hypothetical protein
MASAVPSNEAAIAGALALLDEAHSTMNGDGQIEQDVW